MGGLRVGGVGETQNKAKLSSISNNITSWSKRMNNEQIMGLIYYLFPGQNFVNKVPH